MNRDWVYISNYQGRLGNHMFQFAWAKAVSLELNKQLSVPGIACDPLKDEGSLFPKTHFLRHIFTNNINFIEINDKNGHLPFTDPEQFKNLSLQGTGFFQNYQLFKKYKDVIKTFFVLKEVPEMQDTLGIHIRLDDFPLHYRCSPSYYTTCIEQTKCKKIKIFTDEPQHTFINDLKNKYDNIQVDMSYTCTGQNNFDVLSEISSCTEIAISKSTYSWWAAFLSKAKKIYFPSTPNSTEYFADSLFFVDDEERYTKISNL